MLKNGNPQYYDAKVEGCCRAWGVPLGAISMYKGWSFSTGCLGARSEMGGLSSPVGAPPQTRWKLGGNWVEATEIGWKLGGN